MYHGKYIDDEQKYSQSYSEVDEHFLSSCFFEFDELL